VLQNNTLMVEIPSARKCYPIYIEEGCLTRAGERLTPHLPLGCKLLLVTDGTVAKLCGQPVQESLKAAGYQVFVYTVPEGEGSKTLAMAERIFDFALDIGLSRKDAMIALGGGVVGDLTGFCAATFFRGVPFVQIPTTLLAQVDSSVGGKVAVNFQSAKNGIGAFYQPQVVLIDPLVLHQMPERPFKAGVGEVVKYSLIEETCGWEPTLFSFLMAHADTLQTVLPEIIQRCCRIKASVVAQDETETTGIRSYLNLGHTFAHAYEEITQYTALLHGEAVVMGMVKACELAELLGVFPSEARQQFEALCQRLGLPMTPPEGLEPLQLLRLMRHDKKASAGLIRLVLPAERIGRVILKDDVPEETLLSIL
jgi:3-dehydroquinate synthase